MDLFVCNFYSADELWLNDGSGVFVAASVGPASGTVQDTNIALWGDVKASDVCLICLGGLSRSP